MAAFAETAPGTAGLVHMLGGYRNNLHVCLVKPKVKFRAGSFA